MISERPQTGRLFAIASAMEPEIAEVKRRVSGPKDSTWGRATIREGLLSGKQVCCMRTGVGKVLSAIGVSHLIEAYRPSALIFAGIAGALDKDLEIGDLVLASDTVQHDLDARAVGFNRGEIPHENLRFLKSDDKMLEIASGISDLDCHIRVGRILTGDQFCANRETAASLVDELSGMAIDMEGAAAAAVAAIFGVPFLLARVISDRADGVKPNDFPGFLQSSSERIAVFVTRFFRLLH